MKPKVLLLAHPEKPAALALAARAARFLARRAEVGPVVADLDGPLDADGVDLVVAFGGDGTVLSAARRLGEKAPPLLGVNLGRLGYLAAIEPNRMEEALTAALAGKLRAIERMTLAADVWREGRRVWSGVAVNEFFLTANSPGRILRLQVEVGGEPLMAIPGDGLLVATATGSTGHALSAGGPLLAPDLRAMVVVPVCPHRLSIRPLVLGADEEVTVGHVGDSPERLAADGRHAADVMAGDQVRVTAGKAVLRWLSWDHGRFVPVREKLGWSEGR